MLPLSFIGIVAVIFISGLFGNLQLGYYGIITISGFLFIYSFFLIKKKSKIIKLSSDLFSPAFFIFCFIFFALVPFNVGRVSHNYDEFSFWNSVVKIMTLWNKFGTVKEADLLAATYPPGMACFQYFVEKLHLNICRASFSEWRLFFGYQLFTYVLLFPFLKNLKHKEWSKIFLCGVIIMVAPSYFSHFFLYLTIDTFLGTLFGTGIALVIFWDNKDIYKTIYLSSICGLLVLTKQIGFFLAIVLLITYLLQLNLKKQPREEIKYFIRNICIIICSIIMPFAIWNYHVRKSDCYVILSRKIDLQGFYHILIGRGDQIKTQILKSFITKITSPCFGVYNTDIKLNVISVTIILLGLLCVIMSRFSTVNNPAFCKMIPNNRFSISVILVGFLCYLIGMMFMYIYKMEDNTCPSFTRYCDIYFHGIIICSIVGLLLNIGYSSYIKNIEWVLVTVLFLFVPYEPLCEFLSYKEQAFAIEQRNRYASFSNMCKKALGDDRRTLFILIQDGDTSAYWHLYYSLLPSVIHNNKNFEGESWSISPNKGDINMSADDLRQELLERYDYFLIWTADEYFKNNYNSLFLDPSQIADHSIYRINKETGLLEFVIGE